MSIMMVAKDICIAANATARVEIPVDRDFIPEHCSVRPERGVVGGAPYFPWRIRSCRLGEGSGEIVSGEPVHIEPFIDLFSKLKNRLMVRAGRFITLEIESITSGATLFAIAFGGSRFGSAHSHS